MSQIKNTPPQTGRHCGIKTPRPILIVAIAITGGHGDMHIESMSLLSDTRPFYPTSANHKITSKAELATHLYLDTPLMRRLIGQSVRRTEFRAGLQPA